MSGSPRSKLGRPSDRLLTPCTRLVERWSSVRWATCGCRLEAPPRQRRLRDRDLSRPSPRASGFAEEAGERLLSMELSERPDLPNALGCRRWPHDTEEPGGPGDLDPTFGRAAW